MMANLDRAILWAIKVSADNQDITDAGRRVANTFFQTNGLSPAQIASFAAGIIAKAALLEDRRRALNN